MRRNKNTAVGALAWRCELADGPDREPTPQTLEYYDKLHRAAFILRDPVAEYEHSIRWYLGIW